MKTLINKTNPQIRITAPEITTAHPPVSNEGYVYWIPAINEMYNPINWTLVEEEEFDLEKEIEKWITPQNPSIDPKKGTISREVYIDCIIVTARHFYELGLKARKEVEQNVEQKPEWNEEDEHRYGDAIYFLETAKMHYADTSEIELAIDWLKSLRPQPKQDWIKEQTKNQ